MAPEALFQPHLLQVEKEGMGELLFNTIQKAPMDNRADLYKSIVLRGVLYYILRYQEFIV